MRYLVALALTVALVERADADAFVRVITQKAPVRSGPGNGYREVFVAERNQVFAVVERGTQGYWFKIELDDGTTGWILGDVVYPFEVGPEEQPNVIVRMGRAISHAILGPSAGGVRPRRPRRVALACYRAKVSTSCARRGSSIRTGRSRASPSCRRAPTRIFTWAASGSCCVWRRAQ